jgi:hypothetical protein
MSLHVVTDTIQVGAAVNGKPAKLNVQLAYKSDDPYAVRVIFTEDDKKVGWVFGRDLLVNGMKAHAGEGHAQVWPGVRRFGRAPRLLMVMLASPDGRVEVTLPYGWVNDFLLLTFDAVPVGRESEHLDVDRAIALIREDA